MIKILKESDFIETDSQGNELTPEQIAYFKNSKIKENGKTLICYHGTRDMFNRFEKGDIGFHFGTLQAAIERVNYPKDIDAHILLCYLNITNPLYIKDDLIDWTGHGLAWHILQNHILSLTEDEYDIFQSIARDPEHTRTSQLKNVHQGTETIKNILIRKGYDGIKYINDCEDPGSTSYIAFYPEQAKVIWNKKPTDKKEFTERREMRK